MKKVIVLSTVLGLSALGMACGETPANNANVNKPVVVATPANTITIAPANTPATNVPATNVKPANTTATPASNMKPANAMKTPMATATPKKP